MKSSTKKFGADSAVLLSSSNVTSTVRKTIPTGSLDLDRILAKDINGKFGLPVGRIIGISGKEASGKTTLAISFMKSVQEMGGMATIIETENAFDPVYAEQLGLNLDELIISQPDYLEQALDIISNNIEMFKLVKEEYKAETGKEFDVPMIQVLDSIAGVPPKVEWEASSNEDEQAQGLHARRLSRFFRGISKRIAREQVILVCTNQTKTDTRVRYGNANTEIGGAALKFHASLRLDIWRDSFIKPTKDGDPIGIETNVKTIKNKVMVPYKTVKVPIIFGIGIDPARSIFNFLKNHKPVKHQGNTYSLSFKKYQVTGVGETNFIKKLDEHLKSEKFNKRLDRYIERQMPKLKRVLVILVALCIFNVSFLIKVISNIK